MLQTEGYASPYTHQCMCKQGSAPDGHLKGSMEIRAVADITHTPGVHIRIQWIWIRICGGFYPL